MSYSLLGTSTYHSVATLFLLTFWCRRCLTPVAMRRLVSGGCAQSPSPDAWLLLVPFLMSLCWADAGTRLVCRPCFCLMESSSSLPRPPFSTVFAEPPVRAASTSVALYLVTSFPALLHSLSCRTLGATLLLPSVPLVLCLTSYVGSQVLSSGNITCGDYQSDIPGSAVVLITV
jgi:hypothetical protein